jgi:hypothetical protein
MTKPSLEWDFDNPKHRQRRRRPEPVLEGDILGPETESYQDKPRIRVEVVHRAYQPRRQHNTVPPWLIVLAIVAALLWMAPLGTIILIAIVSIFFAEHPTIAIAIGGIMALVIIIAMRERRAGRPF